MLIYSNMPIISLNMHVTKMSQAEMNSRNHREKFGSDDYLIVVGSALSIGFPTFLLDIQS